MRSKLKKGDIIYCSRKDLLEHCECIARILSVEYDFYLVQPVYAHTCEVIYYKSIGSCAKHAVKADPKFIEYLRLFKCFRGRDE